MPVVAHGIDLVRCDRIARIWRDHGDRFLDRVFTPAERAYCLDCKTPVERLAGRFAAKEAVMKVLGTGWRGGMRWTDIETLPDPLGKPLVQLTGETGDLATRQGITRLLISISHTTDHAMASVLALGEAPRA
ncbi:MAG: holo-ACP synthase [Phycisphaerae bacterium]|jgi:holo-[acyl-carrier protein] synthase